VNRPVLALSGTDQASLASVHRCLLSPLDHEHLDAWRQRVCRDIKELLGADKATFALPLPGMEPYFSEEVDQGTKSAYPDRAEPLERRWSVFQRGCELQVYSRDQLFRPNLAAFYRSEYYNELIVPAACHDTVGLSCALEGRPGPTTVAHLLLHHERPTGRPFGERGLALLRLLYPAFEAGVRTCQRLGMHRRSLASLLDGLSEGLFICDREGRVVHENVALSGLLAREPDSALIREELRVVARALAASLAGSPVKPARLDRDLRTAQGRYRIRGSLVGETVLGGGASVLVSLERLTPELPAPEALRERFGLTRREAQVARLIADGRSNAAIAETLFISPHTARHHTEHIMQKLGAKSRAGIGAMILRA
jgi:DNA-binding CsgD family transcriptional regulator